MLSIENAIEMRFYFLFLFLKWYHINFQELLVELPAIPFECDFVHVNPLTMFGSEPVCAGTSIRWAHWGYGMIGYLVHREGAKRLVKGSERGFQSPSDGHVWYENVGCVTEEARLQHYPTAGNDERSIRQFLNGKVDHYFD